MLEKHLEYIVATDLDGTLLDHHDYSWQAASPAIKALQDKNIPIIFNTSKTLGEALQLQKGIGIEGPLIVENGSALCMKEEQLVQLLGENALSEWQQSGELYMKIFGCERSKTLEFINAFREKHGPVLEGYHDWDIQTIAEKTGLSSAEAKLSAGKQFSEPFIWLADAATLKNFEHDANAKNLKLLQGGRFYHLLGDTNKALPLLWLKEQKAQESVRLVCLGDNKNDIHMLNAADIPVCVKSPVAPYPQIKPNKNAIFTSEYGPEGWHEAITQIIAHNN